MKLNNIRIKVTSRSFSRNPILKQELLTLFPNSVFNTDGPPTGLPNIVEFLLNADGVILGLEQMDRPILQQLGNLKINDFQRALTDHFGAPNAICRHPDPRQPEAKRTMTNAAFIIDLVTRTMHVANGPPCKNEFDIHVL